VECSSRREDFIKHAQLTNGGVDGWYDHTSDNEEAKTWLGRTASGTSIPFRIGSEDFTNPSPARRDAETNNEARGASRVSAA